jgi:hypothetical protein
MTTLVGRDTLLATYNTIGTREYRYYRFGYTATAGTATSFRARLEGGTATQVKLVAYDAAGNKVVETAETAVTLGAPQTLSIAISLALTAQVYYLGIAGNGSVGLDLESTAGNNTAGATLTNFTDDFPATITVPPPGSFALDQFAIWMDGTAGGGSSIAAISSNYRRAGFR